MNISPCGSWLWFATCPPVWVSNLEPASPVWKPEPPHNLRGCIQTMWHFFFNHLLSHIWWRCKCREEMSTVCAGALKEKKGNVREKKSNKCCDFIHILATGRKNAAEETKAPRLIHFLSNFENAADAARSLNSDAWALRDSLWSCLPETCQIWNQVPQSRRCRNTQREKLWFLLSDKTE